MLRTGRELAVQVRVEVEALDRGAVCLQAREAALVSRALACVRKRVSGPSLVSAWQTSGGNRNAEHETVPVKRPRAS